MFRSIFKTIFRGLVDSSLCSYQVEIGWCMLIIDLYSMRPYVITVNLCMYLEHLTEWKLVSPSQVLQTHTQADGNDIRPHTAQIYNERTSTDLNLVTAWSTVHEPPEDGLKNGPKHAGENFKCF